MNRKQTILWRFAVLALIASLLPISYYRIEQRDQVDVDDMLDVSVSIRTTSHVTVDRFGDSVWEINNGSGFIVSSRDCEIWTNHHVVADAALIEVYPRGWDRTAGITARVINSTPRSDLAILQLDECPALPQARLGDSSLIRTGDETFAVGNPMGRNPDSVSRGIISHTQRFRDTNIPYLQTDAAINPGNSGGALFDREGRVIGVNTAIDTTRNGGANLGVGFALPINRVMQAIAQLREGPPSWGDAGIGDIVANLTPGEAEVFNVPGGRAALVVTRTPDDGPSAGKLQAHDVIYGIGSADVVDRDQALRLIGQHDAGESVSLALIRDGREQQIDITLGEGWRGAAAPAPDDYEGYLGLGLEMWADHDGDRGNFKHPVITRVHSLGPAHRARIASSQKSVIVKGPYVLPYLLDVKTITGIAYRGHYHAVESVEQVEEFAARAYEENKPLLLEIELWARKNPRDTDAGLVHESTAFFRVMPDRPPVEHPDLDYPLHLDDYVSSVSRRYRERRI